MVQFIPQKITIPVESPTVARERLLETLRESLHCCAATIVSGRTGTGKTTLAADFARKCGRRVAWYEVDAYDSQLPLFFQYLCASVRSQREGFGSRALAKLDDVVRLEDVPLLVECFVYELLESDEPLLIVIDDLHLVYDAEWVIPFFRRLLPLLPPEVHVILIGRSLPPAPLWRLRSKQTLHVIDEAALAFTQEEARELFSNHGLPAEQADDAWRRTRGRAASLKDEATASPVREPVGKRGAGESRRSRQLRLVKGFTPETSFGAA